MATSRSGMRMFGVFADIPFGLYRAVFDAEAMIGTRLDAFPDFIGRRVVRQFDTRGAAYFIDCRPTPAPRSA